MLRKSWGPGAGNTLKSEVRGCIAVGQCSGMGRGRGQKPLLGSVEGIVVSPHSTDREFRDPVGCCWLAEPEICWKRTCSLPSSCFGSFR